MKLPVLIVGGGGHAKVLVEALRLRSMTILGIIDVASDKIGAEVSGIRVIGDDSAISGYKAEDILLVNGIGSAHLPKTRTALFEKFKAKGFSFATVIHPSAVVATDVVLGEGAQIMAGVVIQPGCEIGVNAIVNTRASIDHDCQIGDHVHLAPGVTLSGGVRVGNASHIGTGATVVQGVKIGRNSLVGAGSVVVNDIPSDAEVVGVPARTLIKDS